VTKTGFQKAVIQGIKLSVDQIAQVSITMKVGGVEQSVTVTGDAPLVDTNTATIGSVVGDREVQNLPLNGRHFLQLADLVPGVISSPQGTTQALYGIPGGGVGFSVSGNRDSFNNYMLDGVNATDTNYNALTVSPLVDSIQEFKIVANAYSAEYGNLPGAQVDIVTRSGANDLHGSLYEFIRNSALDAKNFFDDPNRPIPPFRQNQFGGTFGGPVIKNRTFFFLAYEGLRVRQSLTQRTLVPTAAIRGGDLSGINPGTGQPFPQITDPNTGAPFLNNQIPPSMISPLARGILALVPPPNIPNALPGQFNRIAVGKYDENDDQFLVRIDHQLTPKNLAFVRYAQQKVSQIIPFVAVFTPVVPAPEGFGNTYGAMGRNIAFGLTSTMGSNKTNVFRFGYNSLNALLEAQNVHSHFLDSVGISRFGSTLNFGVPIVNIPGFGEMGDSHPFQPGLLRDSTFQFTDDFSYTHGRFTHHLGGDYRRYYQYGVQDTFSQGDFTFGNEVLGFGQTKTGSGFSDFLLDRPRLSLIQLGMGLGSYRSNYFGTYYSGQFRAAPSFTFNFGLRWEFQTSFTPIDGTVTSILDLPKGVIVLGSQSGQLPALNDALTSYFIRTFNTQFATNQQAGLPASTDPSHYKNLAPRIAFAWDALRNSRLVVRGGFGIFINLAEQFYSRASARLGPPFAPTIASFQNSLFVPSLSPLTYENAFSNGGPLDRPATDGGPSTAGIPPGVIPGYVQQWTLSMQSQLSKNLVAEAAYVGARGIHLNGFILTDQNFPNTPQARGGFPPDPRFGESFQEHSRGNSWYHGVSLRLQRRLANGVTFTGGYTFAKSEDNVSTFTGGPTDAPDPQNSYNLAAEKGLSNFDMRHRFVLSYLWELPFGRGRHFLSHGGALAAVLGDWQFGGILTLQAGQPLSVQLTQNVSGIASSGADRPNCVSNPNTGPHTVSEWFDTNAFTPPTLIFPTTGFPYRILGNCGRNIVKGPDHRNFDTSLQRIIRLHERHSLEFRADFFNMTNHPNFFIPNRFFGASTFGQINSAKFPRQIQFALRYSF